MVSKCNNVQKEKRTMREGECGWVCPPPQRPVLAPRPRPPVRKESREGEGGEVRGRRGQRGAPLTHLSRAAASRSPGSTGCSSRTPSGCSWGPGWARRGPGHRILPGGEKDADGGRHVAGGSAWGRRARGSSPSSAPVLVCPALLRAFRGPQPQLGWRKPIVPEGHLSARVPEHT